MSKRIYVHYDYDGLYGRFWSNLGELISEREFLQEPRDCHLVCFTGGSDVSPSLYRHRNLGSYCDMGRDNREEEIFQIAASYNLPMTGICRGSQFLNVMLGGTMVQDLRRSHGGHRHQCETLDGRKMEVTSSHHQMSVLGPGGILLGWAEKRLDPADLVYDGELPKSVYDPLQPERVRITEAFSYPERKVFAVQHHPEWQRPEEEAYQWTLQKIREICFGQE